MYAVTYSVAAFIRDLFPHLKRLISAWMRFRPLCAILGICMCDIFIEINQFRFSPSRTVNTDGDPNWRRFKGASEKYLSVEYDSANFKQFWQQGQMGPSTLQQSSCYYLGQWRWKINKNLLERLHRSHGRQDYRLRPRCEKLHPN